MPLRAHHGCCPPNYYFCSSMPFLWSWVYGPWIVVAWVFARLPPGIPGITEG
jgi:hypothetical protein